MSRVSDLVNAYTAELSLPWRSGLSGGERVWMLVYPPEMERAIRAAVPKLELATSQSGHGWAVIDLTDEVGMWIAAHKYAEAFFEEPSDLTSAMVDKLETELVAKIRRQLAAVADNSVVALVGVASLFPFLRASSLITKIHDDTKGRLLVLFPGMHDPETHSFRLLDARDGFNYRARIIDPQKDIA